MAQHPDRERPLPRRPPALARRRRRLVRLRLVGGRLSARLAGRARRGRRGRTATATCTSPAGPTSSCARCPARTARSRPRSSRRSRRPGCCRRARHELVRNVMVSPQTGLAGGRADLRPVAAELDRPAVRRPASWPRCPGGSCSCSTTGAATWSTARCDLGLVALDDATGAAAGRRAGWGPVRAARRGRRRRWSALARGVPRRARRRARRGLARRRAARAAGPERSPRTRAPRCRTAAAVRRRAGWRARRRHPTGCSTPTWRRGSWTGDAGTWWSRRGAASWCRER